MYDVEDQPGVLVGVEVEHVTEGTVCECGTEHRDVVLVGPVVHGVFVVNLLTQPCYHPRRRPQLALEWRHVILSF